ncbi:hypothetical protein [Microcoleus sp. B7-D4]|uniref:hypothetical protein n=1 Tax=Microcoleus sp. B7-D4 TaxID=2818696 RepID=UPI002FD1922C
MNAPEQIETQKLLPPATLTEEDEFYAECNASGINLVDRVNGKPVYVYPYWIDRPNCNWHSPPEPEDEDYSMHYEDEDEDEDEDGNEDTDERDKANRTGFIERLKRLWQ